MAMTLYHGEPNGPSLTVLATLFEKGVETELKRIDLASGERHTLPFAKDTEVALSIEGEGPVLVVDGTPMTDALYVAMYLDEIGSGPSLQPPGALGHWDVLVWARFVAERLAPAASTLGTRAYLAPRLAGRSKADVDAMIDRIDSVDLADRWRSVAANDYPEEQIADSHRKLKLVIERTEKALENSDWLLGDFSITDLEVYGWLASMPLLSAAAFADAPKTKAWMERVKSRPSVQKALALATVEEATQYWAPGPEHSRWG